MKNDKNRGRISEILRPAAAVFLALWLITGIAYPLIVFAASQILFPWQAHGSLIYDAKGGVAGSQLIGQGFSGEKYFWSRPSASSGYPYNPLASGGSNLGPTNKVLIDSVLNRTGAIKEANGVQEVPTDLVMASASGLDPDITIESARLQASRVAKARGLPLDEVNALIDRYSEKPSLGFIGTERVNVLLLNKAVDKL